MKRWLFNIAAALFLLVSLVASVAWAMSHAAPSGWRLIATFHSADLTRVESERGTVLFTTIPDWLPSANHGFWDAAWVQSRSGELTLVAQAIDYEGTLRQISGSPPSLKVDPPVSVRTRVVNLPYWFIVLLGLPLPLLWLRRASLRGSTAL